MGKKKYRYVCMYYACKVMHYLLTILARIIHKVVTTHPKIHLLKDIKYILIICADISMYVYMYVCLHVCMYVCMHYIMLILILNKMTHFNIAPLRQVRVRVSMYVQYVCMYE